MPSSRPREQNFPFRSSGVFRCLGNFKNESVLTNGSVFKNKSSFCFSHLETAFTTVPRSLWDACESGPELRELKYFNILAVPSTCSLPTDVWRNEREVVIYSWIKSSKSISANLGARTIKI